MANDTEPDAPIEQTDGGGAEGSESAEGKAKKKLPIPAALTPTRRSFLLGALAWGVTVPLTKKVFFSSDPIPQNFTQDVTGQSPAKAYEMLRRGNSRWVKMLGVEPNVNTDRRVDVATNGQLPFAGIVGCVDSRVPPELIFDRGVGDLFVARVAGNIADETIVGSMEFGVEEFDIPLILVLGHSKCGAVNATMAAAHPEGEEHAEEPAPEEVTAGTEALTPEQAAPVEEHASEDTAVTHDTVTHDTVAGEEHASEDTVATEEHTEAVAEEPAAADAHGAAEEELPENQIGSIVDAIMPSALEAATVDEAIRLNVIRTVEALKASELLKRRMEYGVLQIVGGVYDLETGIVDFSIVPLAGE